MRASSRRPSDSRRHCQDGFGDRVSIPVVLALCDGLVVGLVWMLCLSRDNAADLASDAVAVLATAAVIGVVGSLAGRHLYRSWSRIGGTVALGRLVWAVAVGAAVAAATARCAGMSVPEANLVVAGLCTLVALAVRVWIVAVVVRARRRQGRWVTREILVGDDTVAYRLWRHVAGRPDCGRRIIGYVGDRMVGDRNDWDIPWLGPIDEAIEVAHRYGTDGILIARGAASESELRGLIRRANAAHLDVELSGGLCHVHHRRLVAIQVAHEPMVYVEPRFDGRARIGCKRCLDVVGAGALVVLTAPVMIVAVVAIVVFDGGPVFYRQVRVGRDGGLFRLWKFRTMQPGAEGCEERLRRVNERIDGPLFKMTDDPRVTRTGHVLRATSVDELPQLFNVLGGSMSLVGPRPALPSEASTFDRELRERNSVRPGMTGLWQTEARDNPDFEVYRQLDLFYVENWSFSLDVMILAATIPCLVRHAKLAFGDRDGDARSAQHDAVRIDADSGLAARLSLDDAPTAGLAPSSGTGATVR